MSESIKLKPIDVPEQIRQEADQMVGLAKVDNPKPSFWSFEWIPGLMGYVQNKNSEVLPLGKELVKFWEQGKSKTLVEDINRTSFRSGETEIGGNLGRRTHNSSMFALWNRIADAITVITDRERDTEACRKSVAFLTQGAEDTRKEIKQQKLFGYATMAALPILTLAVTGATTVGLAFTGLAGAFSCLAIHQYSQYQKRKRWLTDAADLTAKMIKNNITD